MSALCHELGWRGTIERTATGPAPGLKLGGSDQEALHLATLSQKLCFGPYCRKLHAEVKELNDLGFITLVHRKNTDHAAFFGGQTTQKPKVYQDPQATANARLSSQLPYVMAASRFAHYIKAMMRDKVGSFMTKENVSDYLNKWIADYVLLDDRASQSSKASYPLREARIDVEDVVGKPGVYKAVVYLRPHFQLDELTASIRLVAELPPPAAA